MAFTAYERLIDRLERVTERGNKATARCPGHDDGEPSLLVTAIEGSVLLYCYAGCTTDDILDALGWQRRDLYDDPKGATYHYDDGRLVHRTPDKKFRQSGNTKGKPQLYRKLKVKAAVGRGEIIYLVEGEKDVLALETIGAVATTAPQGATNIGKCDLAPLVDAHVIAIPDHDAAGEKWAQTVLAELGDSAASLRFACAAAGKDAADHIAAGKGLAELVEIEPPSAPTAELEAIEGRPSPHIFFDKRTLLPLTLASYIRERVHVAWGATDSEFYTWADGVWRLGRDPVNRAVVTLSGDLYKHAHLEAVADVLRYSDEIPRIDAGPCPRWVNLTNGLYDWKEGTLYPHSPDVLSVTQIPHAHDAAAACPEFDKFLLGVLPDDCLTPGSDSRHGFIWELIGYALYSGNPLHLAVLLFGSGRNGKGAFLHTLELLLGHANVSSVSLTELTDNRFRSATLLGKLANIAGDISDKWLSQTATFKAITGGDAIQAERKYGAAFDFRPWALPIFSTNKPFGSDDSSEGYWARWVIVPFPNSFIGREDRGLEARIGTPEELQGILRRGLEALQDLMARGRMLEPESVTEAKQRFIVSGDAVRGWLDEVVTLAPKAWTARTELYESYRKHASETGSKAISTRQFYARMDQIASLRAVKRQGTRGYQGASLDVRDAPLDPWQEEIEAGAVSGAEGAGSGFLPLNVPPNVPANASPSPAETAPGGEMGAGGAGFTHSLPPVHAREENQGAGKAESGPNLPLLPPRCPEGFAGNQHPGLCGCGWRAEQ